MAVAVSVSITVPVLVSVLVFVFVFVFVFVSVSISWAGAGAGAGAGGRGCECGRCRHKAARLIQASRASAFSIHPYLAHFSALSNPLHTYISPHIYSLYEPLYEPISDLLHKPPSNPLSAPYMTLSAPYLLPICPTPYLSVLPPLCPTPGDDRRRGAPVPPLI